MNVPVMDGDRDLEESNDTPDSKKTSNAAVKLERRRRIEDLHEERFMREEWDEF